MKLISIQFCNFRQFYGKTPEIKFAADNQNTTIIHGNNGAGKTTILNGFTWVLYEKFTAAFAATDQLVNKRAITEAEIDKSVLCWVEIIFEHYNKRYRVKRQCRVYKNENNIAYSNNELYMMIAQDDGRWLPPPPPQLPDEIIGRILPESLHQYFFFDGERIEQIVRYERKTEIAEATKKLLGLEVLERAIRHLNDARKSLETDLRSIGDPQTKKLLKDKNQKEGEKQELLKRQDEIKKELKHQGELKKAINEKLLEANGTEDWQKQNQQLETQKESLKTQLKQAKESLQRAISNRGYGVFLGEITREFRGIVDNLRKKGELPAGIKRQFVEELLAREFCICGTELKQGSKTYDMVKSWMDKAGMVDIEEAAIRLSERVNEIDKQVPEFWQEIDRQQANINQFRQELAQTENRLDEIKDKLRNSPNENIKQLQTRLDEIEKKVSELDRETGSNQQQIDRLNVEIEKVGKEVDKQKMNEVRQALAQRRIAATQDSIDRLIEVKNRLDKQFRLQLEKRVQEIFSQISFTPYLPKLNEKYEVSLVENTGGKDAIVAASTGENQILSLSFIGGIIDGVRQWSQKNTLMGPDSSTFPIVMDSPFGSLDEINRRQIAKILPKLANQLVVLVTKTQWRGEVAEEMGDWIGKEYILVYNSPKPDCEEDSIELGGDRYPLVRRSVNEFEYTEIIEVDYNF